MSLGTRLGTSPGGDDRYGPQLQPGQRWAYDAYGGRYPEAIPQASIAALMTPQQQVEQGNTTADRAQREAEMARTAGLATTAEANRLAIATADRDANTQQAIAERLSREGLSAREIAARMAELTTASQLRDTEATNADARRSAARDAFLAKVPGLMTSFTGGSGGPATPAATDPTAANAATFAGAKDTIGQIGGASIESLKGVSAERGAGDLATAAAPGLAAGVAQRAADVPRQETISNADTATGLANRNYAGDIQKRGQNLGMGQSILSLLGSRAY